MLGPRGSMEADDSHRFGTSPRYARAGIPPQREARDHGSDVITLVSKERVEREKQPGTINWIVWLMVAAIGIFLAFVMSTVFTGIFFALSLAPPLILIYAVSVLSSAIHPRDDSLARLDSRLFTLILPPVIPLGQVLVERATETRSCPLLGCVLVWTGLRGHSRSHRGPLHDLAHLADVYGRHHDWVSASIQVAIHC